MATDVNRCGEGEDGERKESSRSPLVDPFVGNVSNLKVAPGPPERGHLVFDACFEGGEPPKFVTSKENCTKRC